MATLRHNSFSGDTNAERLERLEAIENHHAETHPLMPDLQADIAQWMEHCYTVYSDMITDSKTNDDGSRSITIGIRQAKKELTTQLGYAKMHIVANYAKDDKRRRSFGIEGEMPENADALLSLADEVLRLTAKHKQEGITAHLGDGLVQRIEAARAAMQAAKKERREGNSDERSAYAAAQQQFDEDAEMLHRLQAAWISSLGKNDPRIGLIGMVNTQQGTNSAQPGIPTLVFDPHDRALVITPDPKRPDPTSYQTQFRESGHDAEWEEFANGSDNRVPTAVALLNAGVDYEFRVRARNSNGYGDWSGVIVRVG